ERLPPLLLSSAAAGNAVMLGAGYFTPLNGFMDLREALSVSESLRTRSGLFWPVPVLNIAPTDAGLAVGRRIALRDPNIEGHPPLAIQTVQAIERIGKSEMDAMTHSIFGTLDEQHPGVRAFRVQGEHLVSGPI